MTREEVKQLFEQLSSLIKTLQRQEKRLVSLERAAERQPHRIMYRPNEAAGRLSVSRKTIYKLWREGKLAYDNDDVGRYTTEENVQRYLNGR